MSKNQSIEFVTVEHDNGQVYVGALHAVDEKTVRVDTGYRGRPLLIDVTDIVEILPVNKTNPHVDHGRSVKVKKTLVH